MKRIVKTLHGVKYHTAIMDNGVWMLEVFNTEIGLVQELKSLGFDIKNAKCIKTDTFNGLLRHTWEWEDM